MRLGGWIADDDGERPISEYVIKDAFTKTFEPANPSFSVFKYEPLVRGTLLFGAPVQIATPVLDADANLLYSTIRTYVEVSNPDMGESDVILVYTQDDNAPAPTLPAATDFTFDMATFGVRITITMAAGVHANLALELAGAITALTGTVVRDAVEVEAVVPQTTYLNVMVNDSGDIRFQDGSHSQWRVWEVPTQKQLASDSRAPNSEWFPYAGDLVPVPAKVSYVQDAAAGTGTYTLTNGTVVDRYSTSWGDWTELKQLVKTSTHTAAGSGPVDFTVTDATIDQISVYVNGVQQLSGTYTLIGGVLSVLNVAHGHQVTIVIRPYAPTSDELAFDPTVADDLTIQQQYKTDYQYVKVPVRGSDGTITSTKYYFWVKNRSTAARRKNLSVKSIAKLLVDGPSQFLTFQNIQPTGDTYSYNAITIAGLNYVVTKDDAFKLRFTRNFTLRDDPNQLDLKDTHAEWTLIRPGQRTKIPEALWQKMVDTACAQDAAGNTLPSPSRVSYDDRNGTRTQFGFGSDQVLAPTSIVLSTLLFTILNTKLVDDSGAIPVPDYMTFLDFSQSDTWFSTPANTRNTLTRIWNEAKVSQINELFFAVLEDICSAQYELTDIFKTSRLSAYSIKVVSSTPAVPTYE